MVSVLLIGAASQDPPVGAEIPAWFAWYAAGVYQAVMDYTDHVNGELIPASR